MPMLKFYFHDGVRTAAAESLPFLLECAKIKGPQYLAEMWQYMCPELLKAIETEPECEVLSEHMYAMAKCIEVLGMGCLTNDQITELIRILEKSLTDHFERSVKRQEQRKDEDYDEVKLLAIILSVFLHVLNIAFKTILDTTATNLKTSLYYHLMNPMLLHVGM